LDNIYGAMKGCRIIDRFGFNVPKLEKHKTDSLLTNDYQVWQYSLQYRDWLNEEHESPLSAFIPEYSLETLLESNIDSESE
jgi:hypothetical protein